MGIHLKRAFITISTSRNTLKGWVGENQVGNSQKSVGFFFTNNVNCLKKFHLSTSKCSLILCYVQIHVKNTEYESDFQMKLFLMRKQHFEIKTEILPFALLSLSQLLQHSVQHCCCCKKLIQSLCHPQLSVQFCRICGVFCRVLWQQH